MGQGCCRHCASAAGFGHASAAFPHKQIERIGLGPCRDEFDIDARIELRLDPCARTDKIDRCKIGNKHDDVWVTKIGCGMPVTTESFRNRMRNCRAIGNETHRDADSGKAVGRIVMHNKFSKATIGEDGVVSAELFAGGGAQQLGQIQIARFVNAAGLQPLGGNLYKQTLASGAPEVLNPGTQSAGKVKQGMLEASNVNVVEEMVNMIETQRAYEINSKAISAADGMLKFLNNNL